MLVFVRLIAFACLAAGGVALLGAFIGQLPFRRGSDTRVPCPPSLRSASHPPRHASPPACRTDKLRSVNQTAVVYMARWGPAAPGSWMLPPSLPSDKGEFRELRAHVSAAAA
jgi:hypothetical protein